MDSSDMFAGIIVGMGLILLVVVIIYVLFWSIETIFTIVGYDLTFLQILAVLLILTFLRPVLNINKK